MVATLPEAARRRCDLLSVEWDEAVKGDSQRGVRGASCSVWIICSILTVLYICYRLIKVRILIVEKKLVLWLNLD